jgi:hypothetical protein
MRSGERPHVSPVLPCDGQRPGPPSGMDFIWGNITAHCGIDAVGLLPVLETYADEGRDAAHKRETGV